MVEMFRTRRRMQHGESSSDESSSNDYRHKPAIYTFGSLRLNLGRWRNISANRGPTMEVHLRVLGPVTVTCVLYAFCRALIYIEDFLSLRAQPSGVYKGVNKFIPFLGS